MELKSDFIDIRRVYFHAKARRPVFVKLPPGEEQECMCGKLNKALYGTHEAAQNWEHEYIDFLESIGFVRGKSTPCIFRHEERLSFVVVHGDDFTVLGDEKQLDWFREQIARRFEVKFRGRLGPEEKDDKSIRILNRVVEWGPDGIRYEADQRHAEIIVRDLEVSANAKHAQRGAGSQERAAAGGARSVHVSRDNGQS